MGRLYERGATGVPENRPDPDQSDFIGIFGWHPCNRMLGRTL